MVISCSVVSNSLWPYEPARILCPWKFSGKNTGVSCHFLLQGIFPTQGSNQSLLHLLCWQENSLPLSHLGSPYIYGGSTLNILLYTWMDSSFLAFRILFPWPRMEPGVPVMKAPSSKHWTTRECPFGLFSSSQWVQKTALSPLIGKKKKNTKEVLGNSPKITALLMAV